MYQGTQDVDQLAQTITTNIRKVSQNVNSMQQMLMALQNSSDNESLRGQLHQLQNYTNQLVKDTNKSLKELSSKASNTPQHKVVKERCARDFADALEAFQSVQRKESELEKAEMKRARAASGIGSPLIELSGNGSGSGGLLPPPPGSQMSQPSGGYQQQALLMEEEANLEMLREREQAVRNIEQDIMDVNGIFKELATMVHDQGEVIDSIESHVEGATIGVSEGAQQLQQARTYQDKARRKQLCLIVSAIIVLIIIIVVIVEASK